MWLMVYFFFSKDIKFKALPVQSLTSWIWIIRQLLNPTIHTIPTFLFECWSVLYCGMLIVVFNLFKTIKKATKHNYDYILLQILSIIFGYRYFKKSADGNLGIFKGVLQLFRSMLHSISHNRWEISFKICTFTYLIFEFKNEIIYPAMLYILHFLHYTIFDSIQYTWI